MKANARSLASMRTMVLYLPVLMFVGFLAFVVVPAESDGSVGQEVSNQPDAGAAP